MRLDRFFLIFSIVVTLLFPSDVIAEYAWDIESIANNSSNTTQLYAEGHPVKTVSRSTMKMWVEAKDKLAPISGIYPKLILSDSPELNAWASQANGLSTITVTFSMYDMVANDPDQAAALLGHELTHLAKNHGDQKIAVNAVLSFIGGIAGAVIDAKLQNTRGYYQGVGRDIADIGSGLASKAFSRSEEREADEYGFRWMTKAGYDPQGAIRLHEGLFAHNGDSISFLSTHPSSSERIDSIRKYIANNNQAIQENLIVVNQSLPAKPANVGSSESPNHLQIENKEQIGVTLSIKPRYNYFIFAGTRAIPLREGLKVVVVTKDNKRVTAKIARAIDGYYSAMVDGAVSALSVGDVIRFSGDIYE